MAGLQRLVAEITNYVDGGGSYPHLFDAHPPFQIDGNLGATAGIAIMRMQSRRGHLHLLPALPTGWSEGSFEGLVTKGNIAVSAWWKGISLYIVQCNRS